MIADKVHVRNESIPPHHPTTSSNTLQTTTSPATSPYTSLCTPHWRAARRLLQPGGCCNLEAAAADDLTAAPQPDSERIERLLLASVDMIGCSCAISLMSVCGVMYSVIDYCVVVPSCDKLDESGLHDSTLTLSLLFSLGLTSIRFLVQRWPL